MNKTLLAAAVVAAAALAPGMASAAIEEFRFNSADIAATFSIDVVGGQAVSGGGELSSPFWTGSLDSGAKRNVLKRSGFERPFQARQSRLGRAS